jgi:hypothetical protein
VGAPAMRASLHRPSIDTSGVGFSAPLKQLHSSRALHSCRNISNALTKGSSRAGTGARATHAAQDGLLARERKPPSSLKYDSVPDRSESESPRAPMGVASSKPCTGVNASVLLRPLVAMPLPASLALYFFSCLALSLTCERAAVRKAGRYMGSQIGSWRDTHG